jgi:hypothetical protein
MAYLTYFDLVESLIVSSYGGPQDAEQRDIRTAVQKAYGEVTTIRDWSYYHVHGRVVTNAPYSTGTVAVSSGVVTLNGGSFTTAGVTTGTAKHWTLRCGDRSYPLGSYASATLVTLGSQFSGLNVAAGTAYTLYRALYPLPSDFRNMDEPSDEYNWWSGVYVTPDEAMKIERVSNSSGSPYHWTVVKDPHSAGWAIKLIGYPTEVETVDFTYRRSARPIRYSGHEAALRQGTIQRVAGEVTGTDTAFSPSMVGSILRVGDTDNVPGPIESLTPWVSESEITSVTPSSLLTTAANATVVSQTKYLITDPIDVAPHMQQAVDSCCDYWLARIRGKGEDRAFQLYQRDLRLAFEQDQLAPLSGRSKEIYHDGGWRTPLKPDQG